MTEHFTECWRHHPVCALMFIHDLQKEVLRLETQLQYERTGHLMAGHPPLNIGTWEGVPTLTGTPCADVLHDHIEPPIVSGGPTWASRNDEPPSFTP